MSRYTNREMLTPRQPRAEDANVRPEKEEWEGQIYTVKCDDGTGRTLRLRARRATAEELREASEWANKHHAVDLQALADL